MYEAHQDQGIDSWSKNIFLEVSLKKHTPNIYVPHCLWKAEQKLEENGYPKFLYIFFKYIFFIYAANPLLK